VVHTGVGWTPTLTATAVDDVSAAAQKESALENTRTTPQFGNDHASGARIPPASEVTTDLPPGASGATASVF
jgi:hypothetical protein